MGGGGGAIERLTAERRRWRAQRPDTYSDANDRQRQNQRSGSHRQAQSADPGPIEFAIAVRLQNPIASST